MMTTMMMNANEMLMKLGSILATLMFIKAIYEQYIPHQWRRHIHTFITQHSEWAVRFLSPNMRITFDEYRDGELFRSRCEMYSEIQRYLSVNCSNKAKGLKASSDKEVGKPVLLGLDDFEEVTDEFRGVTVSWTSIVQMNSDNGPHRRHYLLTFHHRHRKLITESYLEHIIEEGKAIAIKRRKRKIFTNMEGWKNVEFKHPASFETLALDPMKKQAIINDLKHFTRAKEYYARIGKPWKRGYLLYGPPGTGKSTMIAAMANYLEYDIYDLELTSVNDNTHLRKLLIDTSSKSIIVIEDIDCSLDLTGQRSDINDKDNGENTDNQVNKKLKEPKAENKRSEVTLSGLLNFIDGIWSACGQEKIIVFTTNYIDKLDPALIRRGRMDMHIELSYCSFEAFKLLARVYLDVENHHLFDIIRKLLEETKMTPADVSENLMPKSLKLDADEETKTTPADVSENLMPKSLKLDADACLENVVSALEKLKAEDEEKEKEKAKLKEKDGED